MGARIVRPSVNGFYYRYIRKNLIFVAAMLVLLAFTVVSAAFFISHGYTGFRLLYLFSRWNYFSCVLISLCLYYLFIEAARCHCVEVICSASRKRDTWQRGILISFLAVWLIYMLIFTALVLKCSSLNDGTGYFFSVYPRSFLLNIAFPQIIFIGISYISACIYGKNRMLSLSALVFFYIMSSPVTERLVWQVKPEGIRVDLIVKKLRWLFSVLYQNAVNAPDVQYGLQTETVRLYLQLFWIFLIAGAMMYFAGKRRIAAAVLAVCSIAFLAVSYRPSSIYRQDESWDGIFADTEYYDIEEMMPEKADLPNYQFSEYDMDVRIRDTLKVEGEFTLVSPKPARDFVFTLYHGYKIKSIASEGGSLEYERKGDKVFITFTEPVEKQKLFIKYEGVSSKYYSNSQGVMLPGYFPWYPMAGEKQVFVQYPYYNGGNGYFPYNRILRAEFQVRIDSPCEFVTNLQKETDEGYAGISDSLTLVGGKIIKVKEGQFADYLPLDLEKADGTSYLDDMKSQWEETLEELEGTYGIDTEELKRKRIILASEDLGRNFSNNHFAEFDDYILASDLYLDSESYLDYLSYEQGKASESDGYNE